MWFSYRTGGNYVALCQREICHPLPKYQACSTMKVSIDAFNIALPHGTGVATYGRNLAKAARAEGNAVHVLFGSSRGRSRVPLLNEVALAEGEPEAPARRISGLTQAAKFGRALMGTAHSVRAMPVPASGQVIMPQRLKVDAAQFWNAQNLYTGADKAFKATGAFTKVAVGGIDLAHWTYPLPVRIAGARNVYTLHDLVPLRLPYTTADRKRVYYRLCRRIARDADHILTVSEASRTDLIKILGVEEDRVSNLYQASDIAATLDGIDEAFIARYVEGLLGVGMREYFVFFGAIEPKKNVARLLEAYLASSVKSRLVIVGGPGWGGEQDVKLLKSLANLDAGKRITWLGYLPRDMLAMLIAGARATVFPSLYEGFGLPVLESMALGTPVITSTTSSLPEVAGDAALLVDPYDVHAIARAIHELDESEALRSDLAQRGRLRAEFFSAAAYSRRLAEFYRRIA
jgi:glycosyltransferase involved in cell wall biosynthesis